MKSLGILLRVQLSSLMASMVRSAAARSSKSGKPSKGRAALIAVLFVMISLSLLTMFFGFFYAMCEVYFDAGLGWLYFAILALVSFSLSVLTTIFTTTSLVFGAKDNELLLSMPIKPPAILISRLIVIMAIEYVFSLFAAVAAFVPWIIEGYATGGAIALLVVGMILLPLLSTAVSMLLAWIIAMISRRLKRKNFITLAISVLFLGAYIYGYANLQKYMATLLERGEEIAAAFKRSIPPFYAFGDGIANASALSIAVFALWALIPFAVMILLLSSNYGKLLTANRGVARITYRERRAHQKGALSALVRRELAHYWISAMVVLNTSLASLAFIVAGVALLIEGKNIIPIILENVPFIPESLLPAAAAALITLVSSMNSLSASLISLEGRSLWVVKSLPVHGSVILKSKLVVHLLIAGLPCLFASACACLVFGGSIADKLLLILLPAAFNALIATGGLAINLNLPKLDWSNETMVVKQSASAMLSMFGSVLLAIAIAIVYFSAVADRLSLSVFLWLCAAFFIVVSALLYSWLCGRGARKFEAL